MRPRRKVIVKCLLWQTCHIEGRGGCKGESKKKLELDSIFTEVSRKKLPLRPKASARYLTCMTAKHSFKAKEGTCSAEEGIFPRSRFIYWLVSSGRPLDDFNLLVYTNNFNYMSKKTWSSFKHYIFFVFYTFFNCIPSPRQSQAMRYYGQNLTCSRPSRPCIVG